MRFSGAKFKGVMGMEVKKSKDIRKADDLLKIISKDEYDKIIDECRQIEIREQLIKMQLVEEKEKITISKDYD